MIFFCVPLRGERTFFSFVKPEKDEEKQNRRDSVQAKNADFDWFFDLLGSDEWKKPEAFIRYLSP